MLRFTFPLLFAAAAMAPYTLLGQDAEGCHDHPLFPRLDGYVIISCAEEAGVLEAQVEKGASTEAFDGLLTVVQYEFPLPGKVPQPNANTIVHAYEDMVKARSGSTVYIGTDDLYENGRMTGTFMLTVGEKDYVIAVSQMVAEEGIRVIDGYTVRVLARKASYLQVTASNLHRAILQKGMATFNPGFKGTTAELDEEGQADVEQVAIMLTRLDSTMAVRIDAYTDNKGTAEACKKSSAARAEAIMHALIGHGIAPGRISVRGMGQENPIADNATEEGRAKNRRVEIVKR